MEDSELISKLEEVLNELKERQVAKSESPVEAKKKTYTIGDYFLINGEYYIIGATGESFKIILISIKSGCTWGGIKEVEKRNDITVNELDKIIGNFEWESVPKENVLQDILIC